MSLADPDVLDDDTALVQAIGVEAAAQAKARASQEPQELAVEDQLSQFLTEESLEQYSEKLREKGFSRPGDFNERNSEEVAEAVGMNVDDKQKFRNLLSRGGLVRHNVITTTGSETDRLKFFSSHFATLLARRQEMEEEISHVNDRVKHITDEIEQQYQMLLSTAQTARTLALAELENKQEEILGMLNDRIEHIATIENNSRAAEEECNMLWQASTDFSEVSKREQGIRDLTNEIRERMTVPAMERVPTLELKCTIRVPLFEIGVQMQDATSTSVPETPPAPLVSQVMGNGLLLSWEASGCKSTLEYEIRCCRVSSKVDQQIILSKATDEDHTWFVKTNMRSLTLSGLRSASEYKFAVRANNPDGWGDFSEECPVETLARPDRCLSMP